MFLIVVLSLMTSAQVGAESLKFLGDLNIKTGSKFKDIEFGGISGLTYNADENIFYGISDDRSEVGPARFYKMTIKLDESTKKLSLDFVDQIILKNETQSTFGKQTIDFEGIAQYKGNLFICTEGDTRQSPPLPPGVFKFNKEGSLLEKLVIDQKFMPTANSGVRYNDAFEGLGIAQNVLFIGTEDALIQDGETATHDSPSQVRIIRHNLETNQDNEYVLNLDKIDELDGKKAKDVEKSLSEILAIDDRSFYTIERTFYRDFLTTTVHIYKAEIKKDSTDVKNIPSLKNVTFRSLKKTLIAKLENFTNEFSENFKDVQQIESITFGPRLANGHKTLYFITDNNFSPYQRTQVLAFEIIP